MKKLLLVLGIAVAGMTTAQKFELTSNNFVNSDDKTKNFAVVEIAGKTQAELFKMAKIYISGKYKGIKNDGYNEVENEQIVLDVSGTTEKTIIIRLSGANVWSASNRYEINFKDGKIMIKPSFRELDNTIDRGITSDISSFFNKKGEPKKEKAITLAEYEANTFVSDLVSGMKSEKSDW